MSQKSSTTSLLQYWLLVILAFQVFVVCLQWILEVKNDFLPLTFTLCSSCCCSCKNDYCTTTLFPLSLMMMVVDRQRGSLGVLCTSTVCVCVKNSKKNGIARISDEPLSSHISTQTTTAFTILYIYYLRYSVSLLRTVVPVLMLVLTEMGWHARYSTNLLHVGTYTVLRRNIKQIAPI